MLDQEKMGKRPQHYLIWSVHKKSVVNGMHQRGKSNSFFGISIVVLLASKYNKSYFITGKISRIHDRIPQRISSYIRGS